MATQFKDYYATLGVGRDAAPEEIKKAFRRLAREYHPDVAKDKKQAGEKFKEINEAHEVLSDPAKRKKYDQLGANWQQESDFGSYASGPGAAGRYGGDGTEAEEFHFGGTGFSDFFEQFFSAGSRQGFAGGARAQAGRKRTPSQRGADVEGDIMVTLDEAMHGTVRPVSLQQVDPLTGQSHTQSFQVRIPPGATDGRRIRVAGHGGAGSGGAEAGDLYLRVRHAAHPDFTAREADILHELAIAPWEAVLGAEVVVPTLDGSIKLRIPPGAENGQQLRIRGRGLPKGPGERGDFLVTLQVQLPERVTPEERLWWEKLRDHSSFRPRSER